MKPSWTMTVPVISTAHMPASDALNHLGRDMPAAMTEFGGFVYVGGPVPDDHWLYPIALWWIPQDREDCGWIRFDRDADEIEGLPVYPWSKK